MVILCLEMARSAREISNAGEKQVRISVKRRHRETPQKRTDVKWHCLIQSIKKKCKQQLANKEQQHEAELTDDILTCMRERKEAKSSLKYEEINKETLYMCGQAK